MRYLPRVEIVGVAPTEAAPIPSPHLTKVYVDGVLWPILRYEVEEGVESPRTISLTVLADITIRHAEIEG